MPVMHSVVHNLRGVAEAADGELKAGGKPGTKLGDCGDQLRKCFSVALQAPGARGGVAGGCLHGLWLLLERQAVRLAQVAPGLQGSGSAPGHPNPNPCLVPHPRQPGQEAGGTGRGQCVHQDVFQTQYPAAVQEPHPNGGLGISVGGEGGGEVRPSLEWDLGSSKREVGGESRLLSGPHPIPPQAAAARQTWVPCALLHRSHRGSLRPLRRSLWRSE